MLLSPVALDPDAESCCCCGARQWKTSRFYPKRAATWPCQRSSTSPTSRPPARRMTQTCCSPAINCARTTTSARQCLVFELLPLELFPDCDVHCVLPGVAILYVPGESLTTSSIAAAATAADRATIRLTIASPTRVAEVAGGTIAISRAGSAASASRPCLTIVGRPDRLGRTTTRAHSAIGAT